MHKVDTHFHIWDLKANYYPWLTDKVQPRVIGDYAAIRKDYLIADFLSDIGETGVTKAVHIQAEHDDRDPVRETRWVQGVADSAGSRGIPQAIVAYADLGADNAEAILEGHCAFPNMRGIRQSLIQHKVDPNARDPRESPTWARNFRLLKKLNLSFDIQLFHPDMAFGADLIAQNSDIQFVMTHTGLPMQRDADYLASWRAGLRLLAQRPNLAMKISGFGFFDRSWTTEFIRPIVEETIGIFGCDRCMFASNFPVDGMGGSYASFWEAYDVIARGYSESERAALFHGTAERVYRI